MLKVPESFHYVFVSEDVEATVALVYYTQLKAAALSSLMELPWISTELES